MAPEPRSLRGSSIPGSELARGARELNRPFLRHSFNNIREYLPWRLPEIRCVPKRQLPTQVPSKRRGRAVKGASWNPPDLQRKNSCPPHQGSLNQSTSKTEGGAAREPGRGANHCAPSPIVWASPPPPVTLRCQLASYIPTQFFLLSTWRQPQIPGSGSVLLDCPAPASDTTQARVSPVLPTDQLQMGGSNTPLLGFDYFARAAHRTHKKFYSLDCRFIIQGCREDQKEDMPRADVGEGSGHAPPAQSPTLPKSPCVHQPGSSQPGPFGFYGSFIIDIDSTSSPSPRPGGRQRDGEFVPLAISPHP